MGAQTAGQAAGEPPVLYARWYRVDAANASDADIASAWRITFPADREFWTALDSALAAAKADRNAARNVVAAMAAHWQRIGATREEDELITQWLKDAGLTS